MTIYLPVMSMNTILLVDFEMNEDDGSKALMMILRKSFFFIRYLFQTNTSNDLL